jgi:hypothetical protein
MDYQTSSADDIPVTGNMAYRLIPASKIEITTLPPVSPCTHAGMGTGAISNDNVAHFIEQASPTELEALFAANDAAPKHEGCATVLGTPSGCLYHDSDVRAPCPSHPCLDDLYHDGIFKSFEASQSEANGSMSMWDIYRLDGVLTCRTWGQSYLSLLCINQKRDLVNTLIPLTTYQGIRKVFHQALPICIMGTDNIRYWQRHPGPQNNHIRGIPSSIRTSMSYSFVMSARAEGIAS